MIEARDWQAHMKAVHAMPQAQATLRMMGNTEEQVKYVLANYPDAYNNDGFLLMRVFQFFPCRSAHYLYDAGRGEHGITARTYEDLAYALKHASSITRIGRALRAELAAKQGITELSDWKAAQRAMQEQWSTGYWASRQQEGWGANTYVPSGGD